MYENSGLYLIINKINGKHYVGSAINFKIRWANHKYLLNKGIHTNKKLQNSWNKHSADAFQFEIFELGIPYEDLLAWEQAAFEYFQPEYNICKFAGNSFGRIFSDETKNKIRNVHLGRKLTEEHKAKIKPVKPWNKGLKGVQKCSDETRQKLSLLHKGKIGWNKKGHISDDTKLKISLALKGENNPKSKLTKCDVNEIRIKYKPRIYTAKMLAKDYLVSVPTIIDILQNKTWKTA